jgi:tRNA G18 (ribose-2'-O)-methylase SpoU
VALAGVTSHENVGGIVRTAAGLGATGVIVDGATCDPFVRRAARASMGAIFSLPLWRTDDLPATLRGLRERHGVRALAAHLHEPCVDLPRADLDGGLALVVGAEGDGVPDAVLAACDAAIRIPMRAGFDCFNVATSTAIVLYEIVRRRAALS